MFNRSPCSVSPACEPWAADVDTDNWPQICPTNVIFKRDTREISYVNVWQDFFSYNGDSGTGVTKDSANSSSIHRARREVAVEARAFRSADVGDGAG